MNYEIFSATLAHIEKHPKCWDQDQPYRDQRAYCFLAHAANIAGEPGVGAFHHGSKALGLFADVESAKWLFDNHRTLDDFRRVRIVQGWSNLARRCTAHG